MKNFMEQNLETVDKHKMTIDELLFLPKSTGGSTESRNYL